MPKGLAYHALSSEWDVVRAATHFDRRIGGHHTSAKAGA